MKYRVGDWVKIVDAIRSGAPPNTNGLIGLVKNINGSSVSVEVPDSTQVSGFDTWFYNENTIVLIYKKEKNMSTPTVSQEFVNSGLTANQQALKAAGLLNDNLSLNDAGRYAFLEFLRQENEAAFVAAVAAVTAVTKTETKAE